MKSQTNKKLNEIDTYFREHLNIKIERECIFIFYILILKKNEYSNEMQTL